MKIQWQKKSKKNMRMVSLIIGIHILFIFAQVFNYAQFIHWSYQKQKNEKFESTLMQEKQTRMQQLYALHDRENIQQFAKRQLNMYPISLRHIQKLDHDSLRS